MEGKEEIILKVALELFLEKGYENTNIKDIIEQVGGSYTTIYKKFKNKNQLFLKAIKQGADERVAKLINIVKSKQDLELVEFLDSFAKDYFTYFCSEHNVSFVRLVVSRSYYDTTLQELISKSDKTIIAKYLAKVFEKKLNADIFNKIDSLSLANLYCSMVRADKTFSVLANTTLEKLDELQVEKHIKNVNYLFLKSVDYQK